MTEENRRVPWYTVPVTRLVWVSGADNPDDYHLAHFSITQNSWYCIPSKDDCAVQPLCGAAPYIRQNHEFWGIDPRGYRGYEVAADEFCTACMEVAVRKHTDFL